MADHTLAIIGARGHINLVLRELPRPDVRIVGVSPGGDSIDPVLRWAAEKCPSDPPPVFDNWVEMLEQARPTAVVVCGPFELHARMCVEAVRRGIAVLTEKCAALTLDEFSRLRQACAARPEVHLAAMMQSRYDPGFFTARNLIASGAIGDLRMIDTRKSYKLGQRPAYYHDRATYGGTIPWVGSHAIDWIFWFASTAGIERPFRSVCAAHSSAHSDGNGTMERSAVCLFQLEGERFASASLDVFRPENAPTHGDDWARVVGTTGVIEVRPGRVSLINATHDGRAPVAVAFDRTVLGDFLDHLSGKNQSLISTADTLAVTEACLLARQSADESRIVHFDR